VEAEVHLVSGVMGVNSSSQYGASTGTLRLTELRDNDKKAATGKRGTLKAVKTCWRQLLKLSDAYSAGLLDRTLDIAR